MVGTIHILCDAVNLQWCCYDERSKNTRWAWGRISLNFTRHGAFVFRGETRTDFFGVWDCATGHRQIFLANGMVVLYPTGYFCRG